VQLIYLLNDVSLSPIDVGVDVLDMNPGVHGV